jgi:ATP-dependent DNA helicase
LWSLLNFLLPTIFTNWEAFESWFDFSDLQDEEGTEEFIADQKKQELVKKIHLVLQPLLLRRIKADVEHMLPKKREYILYAPMTKEQTELYNIIGDKDADPRKYLEDKVVERLTSRRQASSTPRTSSPHATETEDAESEDDAPLMLAFRNRQQKGLSGKSSPVNAFQRMMPKKDAKIQTPSKRGRKRKSNEDTSAPSKSAKSSRQSTPAGSLRGRRVRKTYEDEQKLAEEFAGQDEESEDDSNTEEVEKAKTLELASK